VKVIIKKKVVASIPKAISERRVEEESLVQAEREPDDDSLQDEIAYTNQVDDDNDSKGTPDDRFFYIITSVFLLLSFISATIVDDLGVVLALVGATGSTLVSYVLPGLIYVKIYSHKDMSLAMAYIQLFLGIVIMPLALYFILTNKVSH